MEVTPAGQVQVVVPAVLNVTVSAKAEGAVSAVSAASAENARLNEVEARRFFLGFMGSRLLVFLIDSNAFDSASVTEKSEIGATCWCAHDFCVLIPSPWR